MKMIKLVLFPRVLAFSNFLDGTINIYFKCIAHKINVIYMCIHMQIIHSSKHFGNLADSFWRAFFEKAFGFWRAFFEKASGFWRAFFEKAPSS